MSSFLLLMLCCAGDVAESAVLKDLPPEPHGVTVIAEATQTDARGLQIVSVRIRATHVEPRQEEFCHVRLSYLKLAVATGDTKTKIDVIYPKESEKGSGTVYVKDEVAIQVIIQRAQGDRSPVQGRLDFCVNRGCC